MAQKNYYLILGVSQSETPRGIRKAFHELAKQHHPDRVGVHSTSAFQDLVEAYETLSDTSRRRDYDDRIRQRDVLAPSMPEPIAPQAWPQPEPLIPEPMSIMHDFDVSRPSWEVLQTRLRRNFTGRHIPKGERAEGLNVEIQLTPDEATHGGVIRLGMPVFSPCVTCRGSGRDWGFLCLPCMGQGVIEQEERVMVRIPPGVTSGTVMEFPLRGLGIHNFYLRVHMVVTPWV